MKYFVFSLSLVFFQSCASERWKEKVLDACVRDYQRHSYFLSLKVRTDTGVARCLVRTGYLFLYFKNRQGLNEKEYESLAKSIIKEDRVVNVNAGDRKRYYFVILPECDDDAGKLKKGVEYILQTYFYKDGDWYLLKKEVTKEMEDCIINALFEQHVIATTGDESGNLMVPGWQFR